VFVKEDPLKYQLGTQQGVNKAISPPKKASQKMTKIICAYGNIILKL